MSVCCFKLEKRCAVLKEMQCRGCSFRKTRAELLEGREKALDRLLSLPPEVRNPLIQKYGLESRDDET